MAGNIIVSLFSSFDDKGIKDAEKAFSSLTSKVKNVGKNLALGIGSYMVGSQAVNFVKQSSTAAMELERNMEGVKTIFGSLTPEIKKYIKTSEKLGMSHSEAAKATTFLGSVFKQTGMPMQDVIKKTEQMVSLGSDLAATYGYSVDEALTAMTATFRGEYDPIEKFGVAMKQQQVNAELAARGLNGLTGSALIAAQQQIRYEMILQRTTDAQGAFSRSSGNLFQQQQILKAEFTDLQAKLGRDLTPALVKMSESLKPIIDKLAPRLADIFKTIADMLTQLAPMLPKFGQIASEAFAMLANVLKATSPWLRGIIGLITSNIGGVVGFLAALKISITVVKNWKQLKYEIQYVNLVLETFTTRTKEATVAQTGFNAAAKLNPYILVVSTLLTVGPMIGEITSKMVKNAQKQADIRTETIRLNAALKKQGGEYLDLKKVIGDFEGVPRAGLAEARAWEDALAKLKSYKKNLEGSAGGSAFIASNYGVGAGWKKPKQEKHKVLAGETVKTWFDSLKEEMAKQTSRLKLDKLGLSKVLIDSLLSASDWQSAVSKVMGMTKSQIKKLIADFSKTSAAQDAAAQDLADRTAKFVDAVKTRIDTIKSLAGDMSSFIPQTYADATKQIGQFESSVLSISDALKSNLQTALDNKGITQSAYDNLLAYANREIAVLQKIAAQRDVLVAKIEAAKSVYLEVANAVRGYGNITSTSTQQITESYVKWIDGVEVTVSRTVEALQNSDLVATYKSIVDKTKTFVKNLADLKKMGLNSTLFKQIVDAGVDAGGATAAAIVAGGQDTVVSLNDLFGQLDVAGQQMADMTAQVMSDNGVTVVSGFIDGLMSQESALATAAQSMAKTFSDAWANNVKFSIPVVNAADFGLTKAQADKALTDAGLPTDQGGTGANNFDTTIIGGIDKINSANDVIANTVTNLAVGLDRVERAAAGIGSLASVNTSGAPSPTGQYNPMTDWAAYGGYQSAPTYNVTVNAGIGTDGAAVGQTVVQLLKQYERNNGSVWVSAV